jgi:uncharacterized delta-60 repeat protein
LISATVTIAEAQPGSLDSTFGINGKVATDFSGVDDFGNSIAMQYDGKLVMAGYSHNGSDYDVAVVRYNTDGSLDNSFGTNGKVTTPIGSGNDFGLSAAIQSDDKIVVSGYSFNGLNNDFAVVRYNSDGTLDNNFGTGGKVTTALGSFGDLAYSMVIQSDGKIILAGYSDTTNSNFFGLVRYNSDGSLDATFGSGGIVTTHVGLSDDQCYSVALQSDGKIVAAGYSHNGNDDDFALVRYNTNGTLDNTFDFDGIVTTPVGTSDEECYSVAIQPDGEIVAAGYDVNTFTEYAVVRYNSDGSLDNTFGSNGKVTTDIGVGGDDANEVVVQADGKILVAGNSSNGSNYDFGLVRYKSDGSIDSTFGTNGIVTTDFASGNDFCLSLLIQSDGKIVGAGFGDVIGRDFIIARYDNEIANGISENIVDNSFTLYPNPFSDEITINTTADKSEATIFDATGKEILREKTFDAETKINTAHLSLGFYFVRFFDGNRTVNVKAIKL